MKKREPRAQKASFVQDLAIPSFTGDRKPRPAVGGLTRVPSSTWMTTLSIVRTRPGRCTIVPYSTRFEFRGCSARSLLRPRHIRRRSRCGEEPDQPGRDPDLLGGHEVRHVTLERALAKLELNCRRLTNAAIANRELDVATPQRKTISRTEPTKMYGLRRPQRVIV